MATSSTAKKASTGTKKTSTAAKKPAAKKPTTPKPVPVPAPVIEQEEAEPQFVAPAAPKTLQEFEHVAAVASRQAEQNVKKAMREDDLVTIQVPPDPRGEIVVFERTFNGHLVKLHAGEITELPRFLANAVTKSIRLQYISDKRAERYTKDGGVDLTNLL